MNFLIRILGGAFLISGVGLIFWPERTAEILMNIKFIVGILMGIGGYLLIQSE